MSAHFRISSSRCIAILCAWLALISTPFPGLFAQEASEGQYAVGSTPPNDVSTLLRNLKTATEDGWLLRDDFYKDENLKRFSGGAVVSRSVRSTEKQLWGEITGIGSLSDFAKVARPSELTLSFWHNTNILFENGIWSRWTLSLHGSDRPSFEEIESIFGRRWQVEEIYPSPHSPPKPIPTHLNGNTAIVYGAENPEFEWATRFYFSFDAKLDFADFRLRNRSQ